MIKNNFIDQNSCRPLPTFRIILILIFTITFFYSQRSYSGGWLRGYCSNAFCVCNNAGIGSQCQARLNECLADGRICRILARSGDSSRVQYWNPDWNDCPPDTFGSYPNCTFFSTGIGSNLGHNCPTNTANPINIPTGNKFFRFIDYQDQDFLFSRAYNSEAGVPSSGYSRFSAGWKFDYQQRLRIYTNTVVSERNDGKLISFDFVDGNYVASSQSRERLSFDGTIYSLRFSDNTVETYNTNGRLLSIASPNENTLTVSYINNQIILSKNARELVLTLSDNRFISNTIARAEFPDGSYIDYAYEPIIAGVRYALKRISRNDGTRNTFFYERFNGVLRNYLTGIEDENGHRISSVQYDTEGRAISSEAGPLNSGIERTQIQYNADGTRTLTNALGKQSTYHFTQFNGEYKITQVEGHPSANCAGANQAYTYDTNGFMASKTDRQGNVTTYVHNARGQETARTEASGTPQAKTITTEWHTDFNLPTKIVEPEREVVMTYDGNGRLLSREIGQRSGL